MQTPNTLKEQAMKVLADKGVEWFKYDEIEEMIFQAVENFNESLYKKSPKEAKEELDNRLAILFELFKISETKQKLEHSTTDSLYTMVIKGDLN